uniref:Uncharacterized protein n=1 Tax=Arundo donax TaxID=35708 RepID=A0A0A8Y0Y9_ARUDO
MDSCFLLFFSLSENNNMFT